MVSQASLCLFSALIVLFISSSLAYKNLYVGGKDGWVVSPSGSYNHWAERNRFQVNDTLVFIYKKGSDSVFQVSKEDYHGCDTKKPIKRMTSGESVFQFDHSGSFYFISGREVHCQKGQRLNVRVLGVRPPPPSSMTPPPPASQPPPAIPPKAPSPAAPAPWTQPPAPWSKGPAPSPKVPSPTTPAAAPWSQSPTPAPKAPWSQPPSPANTPEKAPSSATSPQENTPAPSQNGKNADIPPAPAPSSSLVSTPSSVSMLVSILLISLVMGVSA